MMNEKLYFVNENIVLYWQIICLHFRSRAHNVGIFPCTHASFLENRTFRNLHPIFGKSPRIWPRRSTLCKNNLKKCPQGYTHLFKTTIQFKGNIFLLVYLEQSCLSGRIYFLAHFCPHRSWRVQYSTGKKWHLDLHSGGLTVRCFVHYAFCQKHE